MASSARMRGAKSRLESIRSLWAWFSRISSKVLLPLQSAPLPLAQSCDITTIGVTGGGAEAIIELTDSTADPRPASWCPHTTLTLVRSNHPLDSACKEETLQLLQQYCRQPVVTVCVRHPEIEFLGVTTKELRDLISFSSPINDTIITCYLEKLTRHYNISYMTTAMVYILRRQGWDRMKTYFALHRNRPRTNTRPNITGESAIILPCFVDDCHWVAVVRREIQGQTIFLYADDLNDPNTEESIKTLLSNHTSPEFYPLTAKWIQCYNYTYRPHSNECGPRTLIAATIMALHPEPSSHILLPVMHHNLAQISRTWISCQLIQTEFDHATITNLLQPHNLQYSNQQNATSVPADLVPWRTVTSTTVRYTALKEKRFSTLINNHLKSNLSPLAQQFTPQQLTKLMAKKSSAKPDNQIMEVTRAHSTVHISKSKSATSKRWSTGVQPTKSLSQTNKVVAPPAKRTSIVLTGQRTLYDFFPSKMKAVLESGSNHNKQPSSLSLPMQTSPKSLKPQEIPLVKIDPPKKGVPINTQRTLFDFAYFKPYASISNDDPDIFGHTPQEIDTSRTFRVLLQNPNGIRPSVTEPDFLFSLHLSYEMGVGAICLAETNLNWHHFQHTAALRRCLHRSWPSSKFQTSVPDEVFLGDYQPGGTATIVTDRWTSRIINHGADPHGLGRWSYVMLRGKSVYRTQNCVSAAKASLIKNFSQQ